MVYSNEYPTYISFFRNKNNYNYDNVNHKLNFVNPKASKHIQNIENLWSQFKKFKRKKGYSKIKYLKSNIDDFTLN